jgi:hypothetical protein
MQIIIHNTVRDPGTHDLRRKHPGEVVAAPLIAGVRLPPRRSRTVESSILSGRDVATICSMIDCGVLRVFLAVPYRQLTSTELPGLLRIAPEVEAAPTPEVLEVVPAPVIVEEPAPAPVADTSELLTADVADALAAVLEPSVPEDTTVLDEGDLYANLMSLKNADLRMKLAALGGGNGVGMTKAQLVDAIISAKSAESAL